MRGDGVIFRHEFAKFTRVGILPFEQVQVLRMIASVKKLKKLLTISK